MRSIRYILLTLCFTLISLATIFSQEQTKSKVPFYDNIFTVDRKLDQKLNYFAPQYENFRSAELFRVSDDQYELEIEKFENGQQVFLTMEMDAEAVKDLRQEITKIIEERDVVFSDDNAGRFLKVQSITLQSFLGGVYISSLASQSESGLGLAIAAPYVGLGGGILGGILGTANKNIPLAPTLGYASGAYMGSLHGLAFSSLFIKELEHPVTGALLTSTVFSIGESLLLQHIIKKNKWNSRRASALRLGNLSGGISGLGLALMLGGEEPSRFLLSGLTLAGSAGGIILYDKYFRNKDIATGNLQAIRLMNPVFTIGTTVLLTDLFDIGSSAAGGATILATSIGGIFLGELLFKNGSVTYDESIWYGLGLYGGYLIGTGVSLGVLAESEFFEGAGATFATITTLFSLGGLYTVHALVANNDEVEGKIGFFEKNNLSIDANPGAFFVNRYIDNPAFQQSALSVQWRF